GEQAGVLVIDEAHKARGRGTAKDYFQQLLRTERKIVVALIDDLQVTNRSGITKDDLENIAKNLGYDVVGYNLEYQFRNGGDNVDLSQLAMREMKSQVIATERIKDEVKKQQAIERNKLFFKNRLLVALTRGTISTSIFCEDLPLTQYLLDHKLKISAAERLRALRTKTRKINPLRKPATQQTRRESSAPKDEEGRRPIVELKNIRKEFGHGKRHKIAVQNLTLTLYEGEHVAFLGSNGAGKTTTVDMICGISTPTTGTIDYFYSFKRSFHEGLGIQFQDSSYPEGISTKDVIDFMIGVHNNHLNKEELDELLNVFGIKDFYKRGAHDDVPEICMVGRSNAGKSSLINALAGSRIAFSSKSPGRTQMINFYDFGRFRLVDMPGYGFANTSKVHQQELGDMIGQYLSGRSNLRAAIQVCDARRITAQDRTMNTFLRKKSSQVHVALNKSDLVKRNDLSAVTRTARIGLNTNEALFHLTSTKTGQGIKELLNIISSIA
ncbi:unnamed protein product, partial [Didymodactylos carnosus]